MMCTLRQAADFGVDDLVSVSDCSKAQGTGYGRLRRQAARGELIDITFFHLICYVSIEDFEKRH